MKLNRIETIFLNLSAYRSHHKLNDSSIAIHLAYQPNIG